MRAIQLITASISAAAVLVTLQATPVQATPDHGNPHKHTPLPSATASPASSATPDPTGTTAPDATPSSAPPSSPAPSATPMADVQAPLFAPGQLKPGPQRYGPITIDAASPLVGGSVDLQGGVLTVLDGGVVDGVDIYNGSSWWGAVYIAGNFATLKNSVVHDSNDAGLLINSEGATGQKYAVVTDNIFRDLGDDAIHVKGTNRGDGQAPSYEMAQAGHYIARNLAQRTGTRDASRSWSFEIQDGCQDIVMEDNQADNTYSIVGHSNLTFRRNTMIGTWQAWSFELGNVRGSLWEGNVATTSGRLYEAIGFTGNDGESNVGNTFARNAFHHADNGFPLAFGHSNDLVDNCFEDVTRWSYAKDQYDAADDLVSNEHTCP